MSTDPQIHVINVDGRVMIAAYASATVSATLCVSTDGAQKLAADIKAVCAQIEQKQAEAA